jgi:PBP1b-binding outer membrane lipoprotein LpoB
MPCRDGAILKGEDMKNVRFLFVFVAVIAVLLTACGGPAPASEPAPVVEQPPAAEPTTAPPTAAPVEPAAPAQPQYAPFCEAAAATGCQAPAVQMLDNKYCIEKVPYAIMSVPAGTTYQSLDPDMECVDQLNADGSLRVTCHSVTSKSLISYDLKVCNGACSAPALDMSSGQCPEGYGYDAASMCCSAPAPSSSDGCTTYTVDLGACPNPQ